MKRDACNVEKHGHILFMIYLPVILLFLATLVYFSAVLYTDVKYPHMTSGTSEERYVVSVKRINIRNVSDRITKTLLDTSCVVCIIVLCKLPDKIISKQFFRGCGQLIVFFMVTLAMGFLFSMIRTGYDKEFFVLFIYLSSCFIIYFVAFGIRCLFEKKRRTRKS